jgi:hypothetical protein
MSEEYGSVEAELLEVTGFKPKKAYKNRQEYLMNLVRAVDKLDTDAYDALSPEATDWQNEAVSAVSDKRDIQDFEALEDEEEPDEETDDDAVDEDEEADEEAAADDDDDADEDEAEEDEAEEEAEEVEVEEELIDQDEVEEDEDVEEVVEAPASRRRLGAKEPAAAPKTEKAKKIVKKIFTKAKEAKADTDKPKKQPPQFDKNAARDRYGLIASSSSSAATKLLEEGITMPEIKKKFGDNKYNLLGKLANDGHRVERFGAGLIRLTHKDDVAAAKPKGTKTTKAKAAALKA